tara:strand:+ start:20 stop:217 length:198 start_codon:yes stop_codon:yes gene_type:complete
MNDAVKKYMSEMGKKGGKKARNQSEAAKTRWAKTSPEERSAKAKAAAKKAWATRRANAKKKAAED